MVLLLIIVAFLLVFLAYPLYYSCRGAFFVDGRFTLCFFRYLYVDTLTRRCILNSLALGCVVTVLTAASYALTIVLTLFIGPALALMVDGNVLLEAAFEPTWGILDMAATVFILLAQAIVLGLQH